MKKRTRMPPLDATLLILLSLVQIWRDHEGWAFCNELLIGPVRRMLGPIAEAPSTFRAGRVEEVRDQSRQALAGACRACRFRACPMKRRGI